MNFGVVGIPKDEAGARKVFEFAKKLGVRAITIEPSADQIDLIEKLIKEYNIAAGIHCHPKRAEQARLQTLGSQLRLLARQRS